MEPASGDVRARCSRNVSNCRRFLALRIAGNGLTSACSWRAPFKEDLGLRALGGVAAADARSVRRPQRLPSIAALLRETVLRIEACSVLLIILCWVPGTLQAQSPDGGPRIHATTMLQWRPTASTTDLIRGDQDAAFSRAEKGALIGAIALGIPAAVIRASMCESGKNCTGPTILWGVMGATVGAVIGGLVLGTGE
jgi:hypothetical protein